MKRVKSNSKFSLLCLALALGVLSVLPPGAAAAATRDAGMAAKPAGAPQPSLTAVFSRKTHGGLGLFDLVIDSHKPIGGAVTIEPRRQGTAHTVVFQFDSAISTPGALAVVDDASATISGAMASASVNEITVTLPTLADNKRVQISLAGVNGSGLNVSAAVGFLFGDATNLGEIAPASISAIKAHAGQPVEMDNFRYDIDASGLVSAADIAAVKTRLGRVLSPPPGPPWPGFAGDAQHTALGSVATQPLSRLRWNTPVDLAPPYSGPFLLAHYGPPVISARNTVVLPVKTGLSTGFKFEARSGANGALLWTAASDYVRLAGTSWVPSYNTTLTTSNRVFAAGAGGKIYYRDNADSPTGVVQTFVFYGAGTYAAAPSDYDATVFINTPITVDTQGNVFFGFAVTGANPANLVSGFARIAPDGTATWINAAALMGTAVAQPAMNSAPALAIDQTTLYVALRTAPMPGGTPTGHLVALDTNTLALKSRVQLLDPASGFNAFVTDNGTSSPTVGPDGDVYFGVLGTGSGHSNTGWMLHFNATLAMTKTPGAFGWDNTPSIVPAAMVPSYTGPSTYLLMTKYNSYNDGQHRIAILDPNQSQMDTSSSVFVMKEILTMLSPTLVPNNPSRFTEWCINTAAVDPITRSVLVNNEDGYLYRWNLVTNQLSERIQLNGGVGQAYTATVIGPDGAVYAVNNAVMSSVGR